MFFILFSILIIISLFVYHNCYLFYVYDLYLYRFYMDLFLYQNHINQYILHLIINMMMNLLYLLIIYFAIFFNMDTLLSLYYPSLYRVCVICLEVNNFGVIAIFIMKIIVCLLNTLKNIGQPIYLMILFILFVILTIIYL